MGYYDNQYETTRRKERRSTNRLSLFSFIGAIIGALIVVFSIPILANYGLLPYDVVPKGSDVIDTTSEIVEEQEVTNVQLNMTSEVIDAVDRVSEAVVGVINMRDSSGFFQGNQEGTGSGVIYKVEGDLAFVVTNQHVIQGANEVEVTLADGSRVEAEIVGEDQLTDLAVLTIDAENVTDVAEFGNSDHLRAGEPAIAIGNPLAFEGSVTLGIISAVERSIPVDFSGNGQPDWEAEVLQTDAAINPGNSGGALLNIQGEVIGINSMKIAQQAVEGIGFSIPSAIVLPVIEDLERYGEVQRPQMGVIIRSLNEIPSAYWQGMLGLPEDVKGGVYIEGVQPDTPASNAGLKEGDVIVELEGEAIKDTHDLRRFLYTEKRIGDSMTVRFYRDGELEEVELTLDKQVF
ncbi:trypsin-like peptidase domain-containing protein [Bacillus shivajii]|uniref:S1C family serine protease n=1 Tax=Bacillus shivajii TaxID=1983719 RepID=UPI001CFB91D3|nr:trypsin-like peptidase domain-containing protein [Bacillus shivajii]UCZ53220.1 trypsin-like peptidase domain-containing protein [Bacillus shivajii]